MHDEDDYPTGSFRILPHDHDEPTSWRQTFGQVDRLRDLRHARSPERDAVIVIGVLSSLVMCAWLVVNTLLLMVMVSFWLLPGR